MKNIISIKNFNNLNYKFIVIFFLIFFPRLIYCLFFDNYTTDSYNYLDIAENISKGCGFAFTNNSGQCEEIIGTAFPGYHVFLYLLKELGFIDKIIPIFVHLFTSLSFIYLMFTLNNLGLKNKRLYLVTLLFALSPLSIGYARFINMDPILYIFTILIITELIKLKKNPIFFKGISVRILIYLVLDIYIKPTSIILFIPYLWITIIHFGFNKFIKSFISFSLIIIISILP